MESPVPKMETQVITELVGMFFIVWAMNTLLYIIHSIYYGRVYDGDMLPE